MKIFIYTPRQFHFIQFSFSISSEMRNTSIIQIILNINILKYKMDRSQILKLHAVHSLMVYIIQFENEGAINCGFIVPLN